jgi:YesN/AraC family two-component response regulator
MFFLSESKFIAEDIEYISKLILELLKVPVYFLDNNDDIFFSSGSTEICNPLRNNLKEVLAELFRESSTYDFPVVKSTKYYETYFSVNLHMEDIYIGRFVVGPVAYSTVSASAIDTIISEHNIPMISKRELINYFNSIPIVDHTRFINTAALLYYSIYNIKLDLVDIIEKNSSVEAVTIKLKSGYELNISKNRQNTFFHHTPTHEKNMFQCISEGNKEKLLQLFQGPMDGEFGILSKNNPLRSHKNLTICSVALATRAAIEGGLNSELAYTLSDSYIQEVEEINDINTLLAFNTKMLCDFADRVHESKSLRYSKPVMICRNYIFKHLYEDISLSHLAELVNLNPNYLSELFKKEVSISISEFIQKERVREAGKLLISSNYSLLEIATWLNFHDQSHFTRVFKKFTGTTPKQYRSKSSMF